jgi:hypothetical protein
MASYGSIPVTNTRTDEDESNVASVPTRRKAVLSFLFLISVCSIIVGSQFLKKTFSLSQSISVTTSGTPVTSLPLGWEVRYTTKGVPFYYDAIDDITSFTPPSPVGYPTVLNTPLFTQPYPSLFPQSTLVTNTPLHKWGQYGIGPVPYTPFPPYPSQVCLFYPLKMCTSR